MRRVEIETALREAEAEGWQLVFNAAPPIGRRVDVMHILNRDYDTTGECDADGKWQCANGFILPDMRFVLNPTHWRLSAREAQA